MNEQLQPANVGQAIRERLEQKEWSQTILSAVLGIPVSRVNELIQGKRAMDGEMAIALSAAFSDTTPEFWMQVDAVRQLATATPNRDGVAKRAKLFDIAPITELKKRGWIPDTNDLGEIENSVLSLLGISTIDETPKVSAVMRKTDAHVVDLNQSQIAWCCRVRKLAEMVPAAPFSDERVESCERALRKLAAYPAEARKVGDVLGEHGIRFVIVEHLKGTKLDGTTLWLSENSPVIGMSIRYDRIDNFWFTLFHELSHVRHRDAVSVDSNITGSDDLHVSVKPEYERRADSEASSSIVDPKEMKSFILRVGPLYSESKIIQFSHRMKIHPGLIVGQLHARNEFRSGYRACRNLLVEVRDIVTSQVLTDGWGQTIDLKGK